MSGKPNSSLMKHALSLALLVSCAVALPVSSVSTNASAAAVLQNENHRANGKIAFVSNRDGMEKIYVMNPDGSGLVKLTDGPHHLQPSWSPDGTQIAFMGLEKDATALFIMNADGTNRRLVASNVFHYVELAWSPDGSKIAFGSNIKEAPSNSKFSVHVVNADGTNEARVANGSGPVAWSPNGKELAIGRPSSIELINADGTNARELARFSLGSPNYLSWSPDGSRILVGTICPSAAPDSKGTMRAAIEMIPAAGGNDNGKLLGFGREASWSPDGSKIVFVKTSPGSSITQIWIMDVDGKNETQLTDVGPNWRPSWQPLLAASRN